MKKAFSFTVNNGSQVRRRKSGRPISGIAIPINVTIATINDCLDQCTTLNTSYGDINAFSFKLLARENLGHWFTRRINVTECECHRNTSFILTDVLKTCVLSPLESESIFFTFHTYSAISL